jgi:heme/copper-type cytochrome/quinol oxidase subunit 4
MLSEIYRQKYSLENEMNIKYDLNIDDLLAFYLFYYAHTPRIKRRIKVRKILHLSLACLLLILAAFMFMESLAWAIGSLFMAFFLLFYFYFYLTWTMIGKRTRKELLRRYGQAKNGVIGEHEIFITKECIKDVTEVGEETIRWDVIDNVLATDQYLFIAFHASSQAHIIPRRAFENDADFIKFTETVRTYHQTAMESKA